MRCPRCRHENRETARFCGECGASLGRGIPCPRCATFNPVSQRFCDSCGQQLASTGAVERAREPRAYAPRHLIEKILTTRRALEGERKQVTVLFADMVDSMRLAERVDAEEWHRVVDRFFQVLAEGIHRFEGTINQFTGDGVMALFGAPVAHEDHARRGCHAALHMMGELRGYASGLRVRGLEFSVRMGLNSGEVVVGTIGDDLRMDYTAQGHAVGLAARMEQVAAPGTVYVSEHTARLVEGFFTLRDHGTPPIKGVSTPVRVFELEGIGPLRTRLDAAGVRGFSRLVGREAELAWLDGILVRALESNGQVVGVVGDAGVGKSRVCLEFVNRCRARGIAVQEAHCPAHGSTVPLLPIRELLRGYLALGDGDPPETVRRKVADQLLALDPGLEDALPVVLDLLGVPDPDAPDVSAASHGRLAGFLRRFVRLRSASEAVVLLLDDAHWIDGASDALVGELAAAVRGTRTLLVANFRPEYRPAWTGGSHYHQLPLSPLGREASRELLHDLLGADDSLGDLSDLVRERTGGNPFFIEEVVQALAAAGSLAGQRGAYRLAEPLESVAIPATVQSLLAARVDRLGEQAKHVLQAAAVIGKQFDEPLLKAVVGLDDHHLATALGGLQEAEFIHEVMPYPVPHYAFKHPLTREVAYQSQLAERRAHLHAAVAGALETLRADRLGEYASLIAHHWDASGMRFEAQRWRRRAALKVSSIKLRGRRRPAR
ncbi:MAG: zinc-ribbon domain-containing protein [Deltaproteobacteria bacterium]|nr:MAG: zinc-ribbon domain-containing protein [Deltaproteobacteria bacterium]